MHSHSATLMAKQWIVSMASVNGVTELSRRAWWGTHLMAILYRNVPYHLSHNAISPSPLTYVICTAPYLGLYISQGHAALLLIPVSLFSITQHVQISSVTSDLRLICIWAATFFAKSQNNLFFFFSQSHKGQPDSVPKSCSVWITQKLLQGSNRSLALLPSSSDTIMYHTTPAARFGSWLSVGCSGTPWTGGAEHERLMQRSTTVLLNNGTGVQS